MPVKPTRIRPEFPKEWGIPHESRNWVRWSHVASKLTREQVYWVSTASGDGGPHAAPVWGIWANNAFFFETDPRSVKGRNLARNPRVNVHVQDGNDTAIIKGQAAIVRKSSLLRKLSRAYESKYDYRLDWSSRRSQVVYSVKPSIIHVWRTPRMHRNLVNFIF